MLFFPIRLPRIRLWLTVRQGGVFAAPCPAASGKDRCYGFEGTVYVSGGVLYVDTPASEQITVYNVSGKKVFGIVKPAGRVSVSIAPPGIVYLAASEKTVTFASELIIYKNITNALWQVQQILKTECAST